MDLRKHQSPENRDQDNGAGLESIYRRVIVGKVTLTLDGCPRPGVGAPVFMI